MPRGEEPKMVAVSVVDGVLKVRDLATSCEVEHRRSQIRGGWRWTADDLRSGRLEGERDDGNDAADEGPVEEKRLQHPDILRHCSIPGRRGAGYEQLDGMVTLLLVMFLWGYWL